MDLLALGINCERRLSPVSALLNGGTQGEQDPGRRQVALFALFARVAN